MKNKEISIIGGGITGLTTALALSKQDIRTTVYEQAPELNEIGAGIWLQPNALQILEKLGLYSKIRDTGVALDKMEITDQKLTPFRSLSGEKMNAMQTIAIHRGRLQQILYEAVEKAGCIRLGKKYVSHQIKGGAISISFEDGQIDTDILLGADGIHSEVRKQLFPDSSLRDSGQLCWRGVAHMEVPDQYRNSGREAWGKGVRFGFSPIAAGEVYWFAVVKESDFKRDNSLGIKDQLTSLFAGFAPVVHALIQNTEAVAIHQARLQDLKRLPSWHKGNLCLIGDAAHATTPNMGQGACQGIEDAHYLSHIFKTSASVGEAFLEFESRRRKKVDYIVNTSWRFGKAAHSVLGRNIMKLIMKLTPEQIMERQMKYVTSIQEFDEF